MQLTTTSISNWGTDRVSSFRALPVCDGVDTGSLWVEERLVGADVAGGWRGGAEGPHLSVEGASLVSLASTAGGTAVWSSMS